MDPRIPITFLILAAGLFAASVVNSTGYSATAERSAWACFGASVAALIASVWTS